MADVNLNLSLEGARVWNAWLYGDIAGATDPAAGYAGGVTNAAHRRDRVRSRGYLHDNLREIGKAKSLALGGGVVRLSRDEDVLEGLHVGEPLESALSAMPPGMRPTWATGSPGKVARFPLLHGTGPLTILANHDRRSAGEKAARAAGARWLRAGREVRVLIPNEPGDLNAVLQRAF